MAFVAMATGAMAQQYCYWGYGTSDVAGEFGSKTSAKGAIFIPADVAARYRDCTVSKVRVGLAAKTSKLTVFVAKDLNGDYAATGSTTTAYKGSTDVVLSSAYTIDGEGFYVGYTYEGDNASMGQSNVFDVNGCWADLGDGWKNYADSEHANALIIDAYIKGASVPDDVRLVSLDGIVAQPGEPFEIKGLVKNQGYTRINNLQLAYSVDGAEEQSATVSKLVVTAGSSKSFSVTVDTNPYSVGVHTISVRIIGANNVVDEITDNNSATAKLNVLNANPKKRMVVEEGTGIGCGFCPRGIVGLETMYEKYPGQFIGIALHSYNSLGPACPEEYQTFASTYFSGYPNCRIQRLYTTDPKASNLQSYGSAIFNQKPKLGVEVQSQLSDDGQSIEAVATTTVYSKDNNEYRLAFVLTENNVGGYAQSNYFAGGGYGEMGGFENMSSYAYIDLQHVARATYDLFGAEGSLPASLAENESVEYKRSLSIPSTVSNKSNLNVIVLVINMTTGEIENGAEAKLGENSTATAIAKPTMSLTAEPSVHVVDGAVVADGFRIEQVYTANGVAVANQSLTHGIYIVKGTNGMQSFVKRIAY